VHGGEVFGVDERDVLGLDLKLFHLDAREVRDGARVAFAARVGAARLIDNTTVRPGRAPDNGRYTT